MRKTPPARIGENQLLAALPTEEYTHLLPRLQPVHLPLKAVIEEPTEPLTHAYFPRTGMLSLIVVLEDGAGVEVATVGNEGMVGLPLFLGPAIARTRAVCQLPCEAVRLDAAAFTELVRSSDAFQRLLHQYAQTRYDQVIQTAACNRHHSAEERCARWLLLTHDRMQADQFPLTHEFLASMLDVRRSTVTVTANALQQAGFIRYNRGQVTVLDRAGLETIACECYRAIKQTYAPLLAASLVGASLPVSRELAQLIGRRAQPAGVSSSVGNAPGLIQNPAAARPERLGKRPMVPSNGG
jgi:CRP-like cAMP-binding protein